MTAQRAFSTFEEYVRSIAGDDGATDVPERFQHASLGHIIRSLAQTYLWTAEEDATLDDARACQERFDAGYAKLQAVAVEQMRLHDKRDLTISGYVVGGSGVLREDLPRRLTADPHRMVGNSIVPDFRGASRQWRDAPMVQWTDLRVDVEAPASRAGSAPSEQEVRARVKVEIAAAVAAGTFPGREGVAAAVRAEARFAGVQAKIINSIFSEERPAEWVGPGRRSAQR